MQRFLKKYRTCPGHPILRWSLALSFLLFAPTHLCAHMFAAYQIDHDSDLEFRENELVVTYTLTMTEMAVIEEYRFINADGDAEITDEELSTYMEALRRTVQSDLQLSIDGERIALEPRGEVDFSVPMKRTFTFVASLQPARPLEVVYRDGGVFRAPGESRIEVGSAHKAVKVAKIIRPDGEITGGDAGGDPWASPPVYNQREVKVTLASQRKKTMVADANAAAPKAEPISRRDAAVASGQKDAAVDSAKMGKDVRAEAAPSVIMGPNQKDAPRLPRANRMTAQGSERLKALILAREPGAIYFLIALALASVLGGIHALTPGHGKTIVAAYLIGSRGTILHAIVLGIIVTVTHTGSVLLLGLLALRYASAPEVLGPWLGVLSGSLVAGIGIMLMIRWLRTDPSKPHAHRHWFGKAHSHVPENNSASPEEGRSEHHSHDAAHHHEHNDRHHHGTGGRDREAEHGHVHNHSHDPHPGDAEHPGALAETATKGEPGVAAASAKAGGVTWGSLLSLGISGGIVPCPDAIVVLLLAITFGQVAYGLAILLSFSAGLAMVLIAVGVMMVSVKSLASRFSATSRLIRWLPVFSAAVVTLLGFGIMIQSLIANGILVIRINL